MKAKEYRKRVEAEIRRSSGKGKAARAAAASRRGSTGKSGSPKARAAAISRMETDPKNMRGQVAQLLTVMRNRREPEIVRLAALRALKTAAFLGPPFAPYRADYLKALREVAPGSAAKLREQALEVLAAEKDPHAQEILMRGLADAKKALVPAAKAMQFLAYDSHSAAVRLARNVFNRATGAAKEEALRLLSSDPSAEKLLTRLMKDKSQKSIIRRISANGLQSLNPGAFAKAARRIVTDNDDYDEIRATALSALAHVQELGEALKDKSFTGKVEKIREKTRDPKLLSSIRRFIQMTQK
jgi:hypothetical protein